MLPSPFGPGVEILDVSEEMSVPLTMEGSLINLRLDVKYVGRGERLCVSEEMPVPLTMERSLINLRLNAKL